MREVYNVICCEVVLHFLSEHYAIFWTCPAIVRNDFFSDKVDKMNYLRPLLITLQAKRFNTVCVVFSVVEPLSVVINTHLRLRPDIENYEKPRVKLECLSKNVSVALRSCQVLCFFVSSTRWSVDCMKPTQCDGN